MRNDHHSLQDRQSLLMHREAVRLILETPALAQKALGILARWDTHVSPRSQPLRDEWVRIVSESDWALALEESDLGNQLRQASPLSILLPNAVRLEIIRGIKREKEAADA